MLDTSGTHLPAIDVVRVTQHYGVRPVLRDLSLRIERGDVVVVIGPNGMGKSTLLGVMAGTLSPQKGHVEIEGRRRRSTEEDELAIRKRVVYLPAEPWLPKTKTGREFVLAVGRLYDVDDDRLMDHADRLFQLFELTDKAEAPIRSYSTGQQKKIALSAALATEAPIMILDEPFAGGLDPSGILALKTLMQWLAKRDDVTVVMATPVPELVEELADRVAVLRDGQVMAYETLDGLRRLAQTTGPLSGVLERLMHQETLENLQHYFEGRQR